MSGKWNGAKEGANSTQSETDATKGDDLMAQWLLKAVAVGSEGRSQSPPMLERPISAEMLERPISADQLRPESPDRIQMDRVLGRSNGAMQHVADMMDSRKNVPSVPVQVDTSPPLVIPDLEVSQRRIQELEALASSLEAKLEQSEAIRHQLEETRQQLEENLRQGELEMMEKDRQLAGFRSAAQVAGAAQASSLADLAELQERFAAKEKQLEAMRSHAAGVARELELRQATLESLESRLQDAERTVLQQAGHRNEPSIASAPLVGHNGLSEEQPGARQDIPIPAANFELPLRVEVRRNSGSARTNSPTPSLRDRSGFVDGPLSMLSQPLRSPLYGVTAAAGDGGHLRAADAPARLLRREPLVQRGCLAPAAASVSASATSVATELAVDAGSVPVADLGATSTTAMPESPVHSGREVGREELHVRELKQNVNDLETIVTQMVGDKTRSVTGLEQKLAELETIIGQATRSSTPQPPFAPAWPCSYQATPQSSPMRAAISSAPMNNPVATSASHGMEMFLAHAPMTSLQPPAVGRTQSPMRRVETVMSAQSSASLQPPGSSSTASQPLLVVSNGQPLRAVSPAPAGSSIAAAATSTSSMSAQCRVLSRSPSPSPAGHVHPSRTFGIPAGGTAAGVSTQTSAQAQPRMVYAAGQPWAVNQMSFPCAAPCSAMPRSQPSAARWMA